MTSFAWGRACGSLLLFLLLLLVVLLVVLLQECSRSCRCQRSNFRPNPHMKLCECALTQGPQPFLLSWQEGEGAAEPMSGNMATGGAVDECSGGADGQISSCDSDSSSCSDDNNEGAESPSDSEVCCVCHFLLHTLHTTNLHNVKPLYKCIQYIHT